MLGVYLAELTPEIADGFGIQGNSGVLIQNVIDGSPAERAGLKRNDVIVEFDGQPATDLQKLRLKVADTPVGKSVPIVVLRDGKRIPMTVKLSDRNDQALAQATPSEEGPSSTE